MAGSEHPVSVERDGAIAVITIDNAPANAAGRAVISGIGQALLEAEQDHDCRAVILTGAGERFFCSGADVKEFASAGAEAIATAQDLTLRMEMSRLPIIAAVNGAALGGGCELMLACDLRIASETARFGQPELKLGILPGWGGTQRLTRQIGRAAAMEMLLTGDPVDAQRALALGLVNRVVPAAELTSAARELARELATRAPLSIAATKRAVNRGLDRPIEDGLLAEREEFVQIFTSDDAREGVSAFVEKRQAAPWKGR